MVNYGVSKGCQECRRRKKKCDETRPSCIRCTKMGRTCPGYRLESDLIFRNVSREPHEPSHRHHTPQHGMLPKLNPSEGGNIRWSEMEQIAFKTFVSHYCISPANRNMSRGFLAGLESLIEKAGPESDVAQASKIVALANLGNMLSSPILIQKARTMYSSFLASFSLTISNKATSTTIQSLITAVLLGLYEIITSTGAQPGSHIAHARGVSAILTSKSSPFDLFCGGKLFRLGAPLPLKDLEMTKLSYMPASSSSTPERFSLLCTPVLRESWPTLDTFFVKTYSLVWKAEMLFRAEEKSWDNLQALEQEAEQIRKEFPLCEMIPAEEWRSTTIGIMPNKHEIRPQVGYWPGPVATYYDLYVSSIMNSYRKSRLLVLDIILKCHRAAGPSPQVPEINPSIWEEIEELTSDIAASIPYHLADSVGAFVSQALASNERQVEIAPGRSAGGLLLMHTLYMASTLSVVDPAFKSYFQDCLVWIGKNMGISQATLLSEVEDPNGHLGCLSDYMGEAHLLIWASMLI